MKRNSFFQIYNVCDQIAQCEDGSDEGPECPATNSVTSKSILAGVENQPNQVNRNRAVMPVNVGREFSYLCLFDLITSN